MSRRLLIGALAAFSTPALAQTDHSHHAHPAPEASLPAEAPPAPADHAAERFYSREAMQAARDQLAREHGGSPAWKVMLSTAEARAVGQGRRAQRAAQASEPTDTTAQPSRISGLSLTGGRNAFTAASSPMTAPMPAISCRRTGRHISPTHPVFRHSWSRCCVRRRPHIRL